jgi:hypothetical protein
MDTFVSRRLKSTLSMTVLPGLCLALFFLIGHHIDRIIKDADAATISHHEEHAAHASTVSAGDSAEPATESARTLHASLPN